MLLQPWLLMRENAQMRYESRLKDKRFFQSLALLSHQEVFCFNLGYHQFVLKFSVKILGFPQNVKETNSQDFNRNEIVSSIIEILIEKMVKSSGYLPCCPFIKKISIRSIKTTKLIQFLIRF